MADLYAWAEGGKWRYTTIDDSPGVGSYVSLAVDKADRSHIAYINYVYLPLVQNEG